MKPAEIIQLLTKYYDGNSTIEEERLLKEFFSGPCVPEELLDEQEIFRCYTSISNKDVPEPSADFEKKIFAAIDREEKRTLMPSRRRLYVMLSGVAATLLILAAAYFFFDRRPDIRDTYSDPEVAYAEAMKILYSVSSRMNEGTRELGQLTALQVETGRTLDAVGKSTSLIEDNMKPLELIFKTLGNSDKTGE
ncbi:MAG: hypothetical protein RBS38_02670 [Bacteroidales bacterium]|jgi:hypothetical protein|nr:hypothetical protein [Bacteroidales bacterium]